MKNIFNILAVMVIGTAVYAFQGCGGQQESFGVYGDTTITGDGAIAAAEIPDKLAGKDSVHLKVKGEIHAVCQKKGCWMQMNMANDEHLLVQFKDYGFFVPMNAGGRTAVIEGYAYVDTTSVQRLRHLARDAEKPEEEINAISEPEIAYNFIATGVIIE